METKEAEFVDRWPSLIEDGQMQTVSANNHYAIIHHIRLFCEVNKKVPATYI